MGPAFLSNWVGASCVSYYKRAGSCRAAGRQPAAALAAHFGPAAALRLLHGGAELLRGGNLHHERGKKCGPGPEAGREPSLQV
jgi:hypothetical protein